MRILVDTNVIIDVLNKRKDFFYKFQNSCSFKKADKTGF